MGPERRPFPRRLGRAKTAFDKMAIALEQGGQDIRKSQQNIEAATR